MFFNIARNIVMIDIINSFITKPSIGLIKPYRILEGACSSV